MRNNVFRVALLTAIGAFVAGMVPVRHVIAAESQPQGPEAANPPDAAAPAPPAAHPKLPPPTAIEEGCGIQIVRLAVTAAGGMVDLRYKILDAAKARKLLKDPANVPVLNPEGRSYPLTAPRNAMITAQFKKGTVNYILYPNVRSAVKPGAKVTVALGDVRLDPITAQ